MRCAWSPAPVAKQWTGSSRTRPTSASSLTLTTRPARRHPFAPGYGRVDAAASAIVVLAVDQPRPDWVIMRVIDSHLLAGAPVTSPRFQGRGGHPLVFSAGLRPELLGITEANQGIREVVRRHAAEMNLVEFDSRVVRLDINTPDSYATALRDFRELSAEPEG